MVWVKAKVSWGFPSRGDKISVKLPDIDEYQWFNASDIVKSMPPKNEWIKITEKMPPLGKQVLGVTERGCQQIVRCTPWGIGSFTFNTSEERCLEITHWKPLDAPPE